MSDSVGAEDADLVRIYAGVLGKIIGVFLGRPFEAWTHQRIMAELGAITAYMHERLNQPLVVTDDDVAGTFTFVRALEDFEAGAEPSAAQIGQTWLNYIVEQRSTLWWGGRGSSSEQTAWLNLSNGIAAPASGSIATNGKLIAEQIGAQIFIDGWALVSPRNPARAARLARAAASVSHDGEAVNAAVLWAAMEAEAFATSDVQRLVDVGLEQIPADSLISRVVADVRNWCARSADWLAVRSNIEASYGYDKYRGLCHVVPNHALMIMSLLLAPDDFSRAQMIVNSSGWDTDCNAGNLGCLLGIMHGLEAFDGNVDWRGPVADRMLVSSADGGEAVTDAVRQTYRLDAMSRRLSGLAPRPAPKSGAQFHFSLPGSVQGFRPVDSAVLVDNVESDGNRALRLRFPPTGGTTMAVVTPVFAPRDVVRMRTYELMASPRLSPGQVVRARVSAGPSNDGPLAVCLRARVYGDGDELIEVDAVPLELSPGDSAELSWRVPDLGGQPIGEIGVAVASSAGGTLLVDSLGWSGRPEVTLKRPAGTGTFWKRAWVNSADIFTDSYGPALLLSKNRGVGMISHGTREWNDYAIETDIVIDHCAWAGLALRVQGLRRYYLLRLRRDNGLELLRVCDGAEDVLADCPFPWAFDSVLNVRAEIVGTRIEASVNGTRIAATDQSAIAFRDGGFGLCVKEGTLHAESVRVC